MSAAVDLPLYTEMKTPRESEQPSAPPQAQANWQKEALRVAGAVALETVGEVSVAYGSGTQPNPEPSPILLSVGIIAVVVGWGLSYEVDPQERTCKTNLRDAAAFVTSAGTGVGTYFAAATVGAGLAVPVAIVGSIATVAILSPNARSILGRKFCQLITWPRTKQLIAQNLPAPTTPPSSQRSLT